MNYVDMRDIERASERGSRHWFSPNTMRFFRSRVGGFGYLTDDGSKAYFVSSEQFESSMGDRADRRYTVRVCEMKTGEIDTVGEFQQYASRSGADKAAQRLAQQ